MSGILLPAMVVVVTIALAALSVLLVRKEPWEPDEAPERFRALRRAYERTLRILKDLEFDLQVGGLSADEHSRLKAQYKQQAIAIRKALERARMAAVRRIAAGGGADFTRQERERLEALVAKARSSGGFDG